ncbi:MAG: hypothetical protein JNK15_23230, partial [Planctomycetes bacterium]|nr:hypothetical protein [Planctomycetota bacterium]
MHPGAATNLCRRAVLPLLAVAAGCASTAPVYEPGKLTPQQVAQCRAVETAYRSGAADYPKLRDEAKRDPSVACWLVRMFVRDIITVREAARPEADDDFLRAVAKVGDPFEVRALAEVRELGALAVPTLVGDLLQHPQTHPRELGVELL